MRRLFSSRYGKLLLGIVVVILLSGLYWLLPIGGQVIIMPSEAGPALVWPQMRVDPLSATARGSTLWVVDNAPWAHVLVTLNGAAIVLSDYTQNPGGTWTWRWLLPANATGTLVFYHDCHTGCIERGRVTLGSTTSPARTQSAARAVATKLGVVFANPDRDWRSRAAWDVELTYARLADRPYWGVDDLAERVQAASAQGLRVLVRVDFAQGQSVPSANDQLALTEYLQYLQRLARDQRMRPVYGFIIGSSFNARDSNLLAPDHPVTPEWYGRLFNGYGEAPSHADNAVQAIRAENPQVQVLVGPVQPWNMEQSGQKTNAIDAPWLNYMNTLVSAIDASALAKAAAGLPLAAPDGFALQAPGRTDAPELQGRAAADEPRIDLPRQEWNGAQAGFRVYRDWLAIVNAYPTTRGMPVYITSANTFAPDQTNVPAQNYSAGWLTSALDVISQEPQVRALIWFLDRDRSGDVRWDWFSLAERRGRMIDAAEEFDALLRK